jgi:hypothetical protein
MTSFALQGSSLRNNWPSQKHGAEPCFPAFGFRSRRLEKKVKKIEPKTTPKKKRKRGLKKPTAL